MSNRMPIVLTIAASVSLSVGATLLLQGRPADSDLPLVETPVDLARLEALEQQLRKLEQRPMVVPSGEKEARMPVDADPGEANHRLSSLEKRLAKLEQDMRRRAAMNPAFWPQSSAETEEKDRQASIDEAKAIIADPRTTAEEKIEAQRSLRRVDNAYTPEMLQTLLRIAQSDPTPVNRATVWALFDGTTNLPELIDPLLNALSHDPDAAVRNEASETLGNYADHAFVLQALEHAAKHDPALEVRMKAKRTLGEVKGGSGR